VVEVETAAKPTFVGLVGQRLGQAGLQVEAALVGTGGGGDGEIRVAGEHKGFWWMIREQPLNNRHSKFQSALLVNIHTRRMYSETKEVCVF